VTTSFVVATKQVKAKKNGEPYLALVLADRTGQIEAKMWDNVEEFIEAFEQDDFLKIKGLVNKYKNRFQLTIHKLRPHGRSGDRLHRLPSEDHQGHWRTLANADGVCRQFQNPHLKSLVRAVYGGPGDCRALPQCACGQDAASRLHRWIADHVVSLFRSCDLMCQNYPQVNRDLLLTERSCTTLEDSCADI